MIPGKPASWRSLSLAPSTCSWQQTTSYLRLEATCWPDLKTCLYQLYGIKPHNYQGKDRNFQGPQIRKLFRGVDKLMPLMMEDPRKLYLDALVQMAKVNS